MTDSDYALIGRKIEQIYGIDLSCYKSTQMKRRLDAYLLRVKAPSWIDYFHRLEREPEEKERFKNYLTINVTSFFRDKEKFDTLRKDIFPLLLSSGRSLNIWSAGCSDGAESYSLAMLLLGIAPQQRFRIWATDIDRSALAKARAGGPYLEDSVAGIPSDLQEKYLLRVGDSYQVQPDLQRRIVFQEHNLLRDPIREQFDLIVCRNVIIYFTEEAKANLFARFTQALNPGGILFIGATETIPILQARELRLEPVRVSFYRRLAEGEAPASRRPVSMHVSPRG